MNIPIKTISIPTKEDGVYLLLKITNYIIGGVSAIISWSVLSNSLELVLDGYIVIDGQDFLDWGSNDEYVINWVVDKLKFTRI
jgi:hypothetical protein